MMSSHKYETYRPSNATTSSWSSSLIGLSSGGGHSGKSLSSIKQKAKCDNCQDDYRCSQNSFNSKRKFSFFSNHKSCFLIVYYILFFIKSTESLNCMKNKKYEW